MMHDIIKELFDYQLFAGNAQLGKLLDCAQKRNPVRLSDEELQFVAAAGDRINYFNKGSEEK